MKRNIRSIITIAATVLSLGAATYALAASACCVQPELNECCATTATSSCCK